MSTIQLESIDSFALVVKPHFAVLYDVFVGFESIQLTALEECQNC